MVFDFQEHRVHDYRALIRRWRALARRIGLPMKRYCTADGFDLYYLRSPALKETDGIYLSAGIHGDEPGGSEGLLFWANLMGTALLDLPVICFPCLNPWGLIHNRRSDSDGNDLNRIYHRQDLERIVTQRKIIEKLHFRLAMCLHEDYDAQGVYLYEVPVYRQKLGPELLAAAGYYLPVDLRLRIEGRRARQGVIARRLRLLQQLPFMPEAGLLARYHSSRTITFETPSEYDLAARVQAHAAVIHRAIELIS
jgi:hypothetical protein